MERLTVSGVNIGFLDSSKLPSYESIYEKLRKYEDAEEQGLLLKLPCKVGDTVYVPHRGKIQEMIIQMVSWNGTSFFFSWTLDSGIYPWLDGFGDMNIGKTVFLTQAEAEQKLKETTHDNCKDEKL